MGFGFGFGLVLYGMIGIAGFWSWRVSSALWFVDEMGWDGTGVFFRWGSLIGVASRVVTS